MKFTLLCLEMSKARNIKLKPNNFNKIVVPAKILHELDFSDNPIYFKFKNKFGEYEYVSILSFIENTDKCFLPPHLFDKIKKNKFNFGLINLEKVNLKKGNRCKLLTNISFSKLEDPKLVLKKNIRDRCLLKKGMKFKIIFAKTEYIFEVLKTKPDECISTINTDLEIDINYNNLSVKN